MNLDEACLELIGWQAYFKGGPSPEVFVRVGNVRSPLSCMEIGSGPGPYGADNLKITIGEWRHPGEDDDDPVDDTDTPFVDAVMS